MIRTFEQDEVEKLAQFASIPVINGLTDFEHPCQVLADLQTIREHRKKLKGLKICYIGDGNNMANSIIAGGLKCGSANWRHSICFLCAAFICARSCANCCPAIRW